MGIGDFFNNAYKWVAGAANKVVTSVKDAASAVSNAVRKTVSGLYGGAKSIGTTVYQDLVQKPLAAVESGVTNLSSGLGSAIGSPFTWIALAVGGVVLLPMLRA